MPPLQRQPRSFRYPMNSGCLCRGCCDVGVAPTPDESPDPSQFGRSAKVTNATDALTFFLHTEYVVISV